MKCMKIEEEEGVTPRGEKREEGVSGD